MITGMAIDLPWSELVDELVELLIDQTVEVGAEHRIPIGREAIRSAVRKFVIKTIEREAAAPMRKIVRELADFDEMTPDELRQRILDSPVFHGLNSIRIARMLAGEPPEPPPVKKREWVY
jgi:hypothetical protein